MDEDEEKERAGKDKYTKMNSQINNRRKMTHFSK